MHKLGILISGRGSNMSAIIDHTLNGTLKADVAVVISNKSQALGLNYAKSKGVPTFFFDPKAFDHHDDYEQAIIDCLESYDIDLLVLAGYMKLLSDPILTQYRGRMVNIHPSLLPSFKGLNAQKQALDYGVKVTGCTVHYVTKEMDSGPIIMQAAVSVLEDDTIETLSARILIEEHAIFYKAISEVLKKLS